MHIESFVIVATVVGLIAVFIVGQIRFRLRSKEAHRVIAEGALLLDVRTRLSSTAGTFRARSTSRFSNSANDWRTWARSRERW